MQQAEASESYEKVPDDDYVGGDWIMATQSIAPTKGTVLRVFIVVFVLSGFFVGVTVLFTSWFTDVGLEFYRILEKPHNEISGIEIPRYSFALGACLLVLCYLIDIQTATPFVAVPAIMIVAIVFSSGVLFLASQMPTIPVAFGMCLVMMSADFLRWKVFGTRIAFFYGAAIAFLFHAACLTAASTFWIVTVTHDRMRLTHLAWAFHVSHVNLTDVLENGIHEEDIDVSAGSAAVLCTSPMLMAFGLVVMAAICLLRGRLRARKAASMNPFDDVLKDIGLKIVITLLLCVFVGAYLAASLAATGTPIADLILEICAITFIFLLLYIFKWVGLEALERLLKDNPQLQMAVNILTSDFAKGLFLLIGAPLLPLYAAFETIHEAVRRVIRICSCRGMPAPEKPRKFCRCVTEEGDYYLTQLWMYLFSDVTSVVSKSMYMGITLFLALTSVGVGLPYFLVWFNGEIEDWSLAAALFMVFTVEILLFLFPPISGPVLYIFASVVIIPKLGFETPEKFWTGVAWSTLFCWFLKLAATGLEQKAIGVPFSKNLRVKMLIRSMISPTGVRAMREIFNKPGCLDLYKVFVLCGGADWPTSVLTGILDLPMVPMLIGTLPVVILVLPCCAAGAFLLRSTIDPETESGDLALFTICSVLGQGGQILVAGGAAYAVQKTLEDHQDDLNDENSAWQRDPQEDELREAEKRAAERQVEWSEKTSWTVMPVFVRVCLVCGWICSALCMYLQAQPVMKPFRKFALTDTLPEGGFTELINVAGYVCLCLLCGACAFMVVFQLWCCCVTAGKDDSISKSSMEMSTDGRICSRETSQSPLTAS